VKSTLRTLVLVCSILAVQLSAQEPGSRFYVAGEGVAALVEQGLALPAPSGPDAAGFQDVPAPSLRNVPNDGYAQVTLAPWIESNGWRFQRGLARARYAALPAGMAPLAAAEAFAFGVDALIVPNAADVPALGEMLRFLSAQPQPAWPPLANIGVVDDGSPEVGEALNMLMRRNLLYRPVSGQEAGLDLIVRPGTDDFPRETLANPSEFAARVRERVGDERRLIRLFGTTTTLARLTGDGTRARLVLVSYSRNRRQQDVRVRLLGRYQPTRFAPFGAPPGSELADVIAVDGGAATEFTIPAFSTIAIVEFSTEPRPALEP
jgi:hypothetical protein